jgi:hypothetical protein
MVKIPKLTSVVICTATVYLSGDYGKRVPFAFDVNFQRPSSSERKKIEEWAVHGKPTGEKDDSGNDKLERLTFSELCDLTVLGWNIAGDDGVALPYSHEARRALEEKLPGVEMAIAVAWYDNMGFINQREAAEKNSAAPSPTGSASTAPNVT